AFVAVSATAGTMFSPAEAASPRSDAELVSPQAAVVEQVEIDQPPMSRVEPGPGASDGSPSVYDGDAVPVTTPEQPITTREAEPGDAGPAGAGVGEGDLPSDLPGKPE